MMTRREGYVPALGYSRLTGIYDPVVAWSTRERTFKERLLERARLGAGSDVLDLGCGTGTLAIWAKEREPGARVVGLDGDAAVLERAREKASKAGVLVQFDHGLSNALPYPDASFDRVLSSLFFHHIGREEKGRALREVHRVLRAGGELHIVDWGRPANALMRGLFLSIQLLDGFANTRDHVEGRMPELIREAGFAWSESEDGLATIFGTLSFWSAKK